MYNVKIQKNADGSIITPYSNPEMGYIVVKSETRKIVNGWARMSTRTAIIRGDVAMLNDIIASNKDLTLKGQIVVTEYLETQLPAHLYKSLHNEKSGKSYEELAATYVKTAGKDGETLTHNGERILRFTDYDETGSLHDTVIQHNNAVIGSNAPKSAEKIEADSPF